MTYWLMLIEWYSMNRTSQQFIIKHFGYTKYSIFYWPTRDLTIGKWASWQANQADWNNSFIIKIQHFMAWLGEMMCAFAQCFAMCRRVVYIALSIGWLWMDVCKWFWSGRNEHQTLITFDVIALICWQMRPGDDERVVQDYLLRITPWTL